MTIEEMFQSVDDEIEFLKSFGLDMSEKALKQYAQKRKFRIAVTKLRESFESTALYCFMVKIVDWLAGRLKR